MAKGRLLGESWGTLVITLLITTHEPPSRVSGFRLQAEASSTQERTPHRKLALRRMDLVPGLWRVGLKGLGLLGFWVFVGLRVEGLGFKG